MTESAVSARSTSPEAPEATGSAGRVLDPTGVPGRSAPGPDLSGLSAQDAIEYCFRRGWTDGMPVVPCTEESLARFLAQTDRDPDEVLLEMPHLARRCTVRLAAINAVMAGCLPEYLPVVLAAWDALRALGVGRSALWQSTTGSAPFLLVNGPVAQRIEVNGAGNVFGSGFRANATIGRAIRLTALNVFALRPHLLDQATQGTPAKYSCCIAENEAASPWPGFHEDHGFAREDSTVSAWLIRGSLYLEARHTSSPEQLLYDVVDSAGRTGRLVGTTGAIILVFGPEHARLLAEAGWSKADVQRFVYEHTVRTPEDLDRVGKGAVSRRTRWRVPIDHPDAIEPEEGRTPVHTLGSPESVRVIVAGADNAGVSTILETAGRADAPPAIARVAGPPA